MFMDLNKYVQVNGYIIGIFENCYLNNKPLPVVNQELKRGVLHIRDTVEMQSLKKINLEIIV